MKINCSFNWQHEDEKYDNFEADKINLIKSGKNYCYCFLEINGYETDEIFAGKLKIDPINTTTQILLKWHIFMDFFVLMIFFKEKNYQLQLKRTIN